MKKNIKKLKKLFILSLFALIVLSSSSFVKAEPGYTSLEVSLPSSSLAESLLSCAILEDQETPTYVNGKYTNGKYRSEGEPSVAKLYYYCLTEFFKGLPLRSNHYYYGQRNFDINKLVEKSEIPQSSFSPKITWLKHASFLIQIGNVNILVDPILAETSKLFPCNFETIYTQEDMPEKIDVILITHNHVDHMDIKSLHILKAYSEDVLVCVPSGNKEKFSDVFGFEKICEFNWWDSLPFLDSQVTFTFLPAIHWTVFGLGFRCANKAHWGGWMISHNNGEKDFNIYCGGDTYYNEKLFSDIAEQFPSIDVAIMGIGPNKPKESVEHVHLDAQMAVQALIKLKAKCLVPMHFGAYRIGTDRFKLPFERLMAEWGSEENMYELDGKKMCLLPFGGQVEFA